MRRTLFPVLLLVALGFVTWPRDPAPPRNRSQVVRFIQLPLPAKTELVKHLGRFDLEAAWQMTSPHERFGGYSALAPIGGGRLLAISDRGFRLEFSPPGVQSSPPIFGPIRKGMGKEGYDAESVTLDPASGSLWLGWENSNSISRHRLDFGAYAVVRPPAMQDWLGNSGPEALARLGDGRFIILREGMFENASHLGLLFAGDPLVVQKPPRAFVLTGPPGFNPVDIAQLPDGRVLILMRKLLWPMPARFAGRIVIADPQDLETSGSLHGTVVAKLSSSLPVDNFEGLAIEPRDDGKVTVWLISDDNGALTQRTLLWKLAVDPAELPGTSKRAHGSSARPSAKQQ